MNKILKLFLPKTSTLAKMGAKSIRETIDKNQDKMLIAARYAEYVKKASEIQTKIATWIADGKLDAVEEQELAETLEPLFEKLYDLI